MHGYHFYTSLGLENPPEFASVELLVLMHMHSVYKGAIIFLSSKVPYKSKQYRQKQQTNHPK